MATGIPLNGNGNGSAAHSRYWVEYAGKGGKSPLLAPKATFESVFESGQEPQNRLIYGDNLKAMLTLADRPDLYGKVQLIYIDPPFATQSRFVDADDRTAYEDSLGGADYIEAMRVRLAAMRDLMSDSASIYVHLDSIMVFPIKLIMDELFGPSQFRSMITRIKCNPKNFTSRQYGDVVDYILFYSKTKEYVWNQPYIEWDEETAAAQYSYMEEGTGRRYKKVPVHAPGTRNGSTGSEWRGRMPPPGKHWVLTPTRLDDLDAQGRIYWSPTGNPRRKIYLDESPGIKVSNIWTEFRDTQNQNARTTGYPTEKNLHMLERIVSASSEPGGLVLDAFCGSGTTLAAADVLGRKWIGIDSSAEAIRTTTRRLLGGTPRMGSYARETHLQHDGPDNSHVAKAPFELLVDPDLEAVVPLQLIGKSESA